MPYTLSNIRSDDASALARAEQFLQDNPSQGVRPRRRRQLEYAMRTGLGLFIASEKDLVGISLVYKYDIEPAGAVYSEIGTMRVTANGLGLQALMAQIHLFQIRLEESDSLNFPDIFAVVSPDSPSEHNLTMNAGMTLWEPPDELKAERTRAGMPFDASKRVLRADPSSFDAAQSSLQRWHAEDRTFHTPKGDQLIRLDLGWLTPDVLTVTL